MPPSGPILGIDLGSVESSCALWLDGVPNPIPNEFGSLTTPTVVAKVEGQLYVGRAALELRSSRPHCCAWSFRSGLGSPRRIRWAGMRSGAVSLTSLFLAKLREDAERFLGVRVERAVIAVPTSFDSAARRDLCQAARLAGLALEELIPEPVAAARSQSAWRRADPGHWLIVDVGGSGATWNLVEAFDGRFELLATESVECLGGESLTARLVDRAIRVEFGEDAEPEEYAPPRVGRLWREVDLAKRELASAETALIEMPDREGQIDLCASRYLLLREQVLEQAVGRLGDLDALLATLFERAGVVREELDHCLVVGGGARLHGLVERLAELADLPLVLGEESALAIGLGAAAQGGELREEERLSSWCPEPSARREGARAGMDLLWSATARLADLPPGRRSILQGLIETYERALEHGSEDVLEASRRVLSLFLARSVEGDAA